MVNIYMSSSQRTAIIFKYFSSFAETSKMPRNWKFNVHLEYVFKSSIISLSLFHCNPSVCLSWLCTLFLCSPLYFQISCYARKEGITNSFSIKKEFSSCLGLHWFICSFTVLFIWPSLWDIIFQFIHLRYAFIYASSNLISIFLQLQEDQSKISVQSLSIHKKRSNVLVVFMCSCSIRVLSLFLRTGLPSMVLNLPH